MRTSKKYLEMAIVVKHETFKEKKGKYKIRTCNYIKLNKKQYKVIENIVFNKETPVNISMNSDKYLDQTMTLDNRDLIKRTFYYCFDKEQSTALTQLPKLE